MPAPASRFTAARNRAIGGPQKTGGPKNNTRGHLGDHDVSPNTTAPNPKVPKANIPERNDSLLKNCHIVKKPSPFVESLKSFFERYFGELFKVLEPSNLDVFKIMTIFESLQSEVREHPIETKTTICLTHRENPGVADPSKPEQKPHRIGTTSLEIISDGEPVPAQGTEEHAGFFASCFKHHREAICEDLIKNNPSTEDVYRAIEAKGAMISQTLEDRLNDFGFTLKPKPEPSTSDTDPPYLRLQDQYVRDAKRDLYAFQQKRTETKDNINQLIANITDLLKCADDIEKQHGTPLTAAEKQMLFLRLQNLCVQQTAIALQEIQAIVGKGPILAQSTSTQMWALTLDQGRFSLTFTKKEVFENTSYFFWDTGRNGTAEENLGLTVSMPIEVLWQAENPTAQDLTYDEVTFERSFSPDQTETMNW